MRSTPTPARSTNPLKDSLRPLTVKTTLVPRSRVRPVTIALPGAGAEAFRGAGDGAVRLAP